MLDREQQHYTNLVLEDCKTLGVEIYGDDNHLQDEFVRDTEAFYKMLKEEFHSSSLTEKQLGVKRLKDLSLRIKSRILSLCGPFPISKFKKLDEFVNRFFVWARLSI